MDNVHAANKLLGLILTADIAWYLAGVPHPQTLRRLRHQAKGRVAKELDRILALGAGVPRFIHIFVEEFL